MIKQADLQDASAVAALASELWPNHEPGELEREMIPLLRGQDAAIFLYMQTQTPVAFAQCQLRRDYVEGTESSPVGYLEGIYVRQAYRKQGIARKLLAACESWAEEKGCLEFASDCEITNEESLCFHLNVGFLEANRIICFTKKLKS